MSIRRRRAAGGFAASAVPAGLVLPAALVLTATLALTACSAGDTSSAGPGGVSSTAAAPSSTTPEVITSTVPVAMPPFIARVMWVQLASGRSLQVYPTASGRAAQGVGDADTAWAEVLADDATADSPGMRAQFDCHWTFARIVAPDKPSWNLEPWRPVVTAQQMIDSRCNPGGAEE